MYKTEVETRCGIRNIAIVRMDKEGTDVNLYVRETVDCCVTGEAEITISPEVFIDLVYPILKAKGYTLTPTPEGY
jgi:hypothetical protein